MSAKELNINDLPLEMLGHILQFLSSSCDLDNCKLVCQRWSPLATDLRNRRTTAAIKRLRLGITATNVIKVDDKLQIESVCNYRNDVYVVGRRITDELSQMYKLNVSSKTLEHLQTTGVLPHSGCKFLLLNYGDELVYFYKDCALEQIYFYNIENRSWRMKTISNPFTVYIATYLVVEDNLIVYNKTTSDILVLDLVTMSWWMPKQFDSCHRYLDHIYTENNDCYFLESWSGEIWKVTVDVRDKTKVWTWTKIAVESIYQPMDLYSSCIVDDCVFCLGAISFDSLKNEMAQAVLKVDFRNASKENKVRYEMFELPKCSMDRPLFFLGFTGFDFIALEGECQQLLTPFA